MEFRKVNTERLFYKNKYSERQKENDDNKLLAYLPQSQPAPHTECKFIRNKQMTEVLAHIDPNVSILGWKNPLSPLSSESQTLQ